MTRLLSYALVLALASCAADAPVTFSGPLTPIAGTCDAPGVATVILHNTALQFLPRSGVVVLDGTISPEGAVQATSVAPGMDHKPYPLAFTGQRLGDAVTGVFITPRCRYAVKLAAASR